MNIEHILEAKANLDLLVGEAVDNYFTHKDYPLDERWELYEKLNSLLPIAPWYSDNAIEKTLGDISLYDDFGIERYQTVLYTQQVEVMEEDLGYAEEQENIPYVVPRDPYEPHMSREQINTFKEHILASGKQGFIFDW